MLLTRRNRNWNNSHLSPGAAGLDGDEVDHPLAGPVEPAMQGAVVRRVVIDAPLVAAYAGDRSGAVSFSPELAQPSPRSQEESEILPNFTKLDLFICIYSIVSYVLDVGSDIWLAIQYYQLGQKSWFSLTIAPPIIASLVMTALSLLWYHTDTAKGLETSIPRWRWALRILFHILQLGPLIR